MKTLVLGNGQRNSAELVNNGHNGLQNAEPPPVNNEKVSSGRLDGVDAQMESGLLMNSSVLENVDPVMDNDFEMRRVLQALNNDFLKASTDH